MFCHRPGKHTAGTAGVLYKYSKKYRIAKKYRQGRLHYGKNFVFLQAMFN